MQLVVPAADVRVRSSYSGPQERLEQYWCWYWAEA